MGGRSAQKSEKTTKEEAEIDQNCAFHAPVVDFRGDRAEKCVRGDALGSNTPRARVCSRARFLLAARSACFQAAAWSVIFSRRTGSSGKSAL